MRPPVRNTAVSRHLREWLLLVLALLALLAAAQRGAWFARVDDGLYDASAAWSGHPAPADVLILAIDEASLSRIGRWPWSRHLLARALENLARAGSGPVLLDVILAEPQAPDASADAHLAGAMAAHGRVVLPLLMPEAPRAALRPLPAFAAVARLGHAQALVDADGVTRRFLPYESDGRTMIPHLALQLLAVGGVGSAGALPAQPRLVAFAGPAGHFARLPLADVIEARVEPAQLRGRIVLIGATAAGLGDTVVTPLAGVNGAMPGVEFVANVLDALRGARLREYLSPGWQLALSVPLVLLCLVGLLLLPPRRALWLTAAVLLGAPLLAWLLLLGFGRWWPPASVMAATLLAYPLWSWRRLEASLATMARETGRIAGLLHPGERPRALPRAPRFLDPVEDRIAAITRAVDEVAGALAPHADVARSHQERDDMMRQLAHDLRSPLVSLRALADQLRAGNPAEHAALLTRVDACARRSLELTEQFLHIGRAQALEPEGLTEVDLVQLLHDCADDLWEDAQTLGGRVERRCTLDLALVRGDERLLRRALLNLGWNALRHGPPDATVTLSLERDGNAYLLAVQDQGEGFALEAGTGVHKPPVRGRSRNQGHGLGLALVRLVAGKHRARLELTHPVGGGFRVALRLPCA